MTVLLRLWRLDSLSIAGHLFFQRHGEQWFEIVRAANGKDHSVPKTLLGTSRTRSEAPSVLLLVHKEQRLTTKIKTYHNSYRCAVFHSSFDAPDLIPIHSKTDNIDDRTDSIKWAWVLEIDNRCKHNTWSGWRYTVRDQWRACLWRRPDLDPLFLGCKLFAWDSGGTKWKPYQNLTNTDTLQATMIPPLPTPGIWQASLCAMWFLERTH